MGTRDKYLAPTATPEQGERGKCVARVTSMYLAPYSWMKSNPNPSTAANNSGIALQSVDSSRHDFNYQHNLVSEWTDRCRVDTTRAAFPYID